MSQVKSKNTKPEIFTFAILDKLKIKYEKHYKISGRPDIAILDKKIAVFINGEFWHGRYFKKERDEYQDFWIKKISTNIKRDRKNYRFLKKEGWVVIKIWDKDLKKNPEKEIKKILKALNVKQTLSGS